MTQYAFFCYHRKEDNVLETCINSFRHANSEANIIIATDGVPLYLKDRMHKEYKVTWVDVPKERMEKRRATCKVEELCSLVQSAREGDLILASDVDVYFMKDPFVPFEEHKAMDLGVTTRGYDYLFPINGGVFYIRVNKAMRAWMRWHVEQIYHPTWPPYIKLRKRYHHERFGLDWSVGQDFLIANWLRREDVWETHKIHIEDVGPEYNFCPPTDLWGMRAFQEIERSLIQEDKAVLHLKSQLKKMIYQGILPLAVTRNPKGTLAWL